jgi:hypothetical protein
MLHMLLWLYTHVSSTCFKCFICFRRMLQTFHLDVSKVDFKGEHIFYVLLLRGSPRRLVLCACGRMTTPPASAVVVCACGCGSLCFKSMLLLLLHGSLCRLLVLRACCLLLLMPLCVCMRTRESGGGSSGPRSMGEQAVFRVGV